MNKQTRDERLRRLLREADPAADDAELSREEVREMRRTVLSAIPETRRRWGLVPILAGAAAAILALLLGLTTWLDSGSPTAPSRQPPRVAVRPGKSPVPVVPVPPAAPTTRASSERATAQTSATPRRRTPRRRPSAPKASIPEPTVIAEAETHQIQFSTPGGTRIIWVLTSDKTAD